MSTRHILCVTFLVITALPGVASAAGINIRWNECFEGGGVINRNFACNTNAGSNVLVASFDPPDGITRLVGCSARIEMRASSTVPSWWQMSAGGCRADALHIAFGPAGAGSCSDPWQGAAMGSITYQVGVDGSPERARFTVSCGVPEILAGPVQAGTEYIAFRVIMENAHTVGAGACAGCLDPACIGFTALWLYQPAGMGDHMVCSPLNNNLVTWQGGAIGSPGCPGTDGPPPFPEGCGATPASRRTWGLIKSLYR